jgi:hypothetical protein
LLGAGLVLAAGAVAIAVAAARGDPIRVNVRAKTARKRPFEASYR